MTKSQLREISGANPLMAMAFALTRPRARTLGGQVFSFFSSKTAKDSAASIVSLVEQGTFMKRIILSLILLAATLCGDFAQDPIQRRVRQQSSEPQPAPDLPKFDLDFPGGTPDQLVEAITQQIPILNVIVPSEHKEVKLPAMKMRNVNVKQLFEALEAANQKTIPYQTAVGPQGPFQVSERVITVGFRTREPITEESVWHFYVTKPPTMDHPKSVRYYQLNPYLTEFKIDDITTAIQAGWKMLGEAETPKMNFHEDTKLLIAVGQSGQLALIDMVLSELHKALSPETKEAMRVTGKPGITPPK
jgi:hypothetical protein